MTWVSSISSAAKDRYENFHKKTVYLQEGINGARAPEVKGLTEGQKAAYRSLLAKKMFDTGYVPRVGSYTSPYSQAVINWALGKGPNPAFPTMKPASFVEEIHFTFRAGMIWFLSLPLCFWYFKQNSHANNVWAKDIRRIHLDAWAGQWSSRKSLHTDAPSGLGPGSQAIDLGFRRRYRAEREAFFFEKSITKKVPTVAPWSNLRKEDVESYGWGWDPKLDAEYESARTMMKELDEAKKIGGAAARDEWLAHYQKRFDAKLPIPRQWWSVFENLNRSGEKHPVLLLTEELPWYSFTHRPTLNFDKLREMPEHPYVELHHELHGLEKYL